MMIVFLFPLQITSLFFCVDAFPLTSPRIVPDSLERGEKTVFNRSQIKETLCYNIKVSGEVTKLVELHHHLSLSLGTTKLRKYNKS